MAAQAKIDPMHQFQIDPIVGQLGNPFAFTNSALWMLILLALITGFMLLGMRRQLVPNRWQVAAEGLVGFVDNMVEASIGPKGRAYMPWVFTAFIFILFANFIGTMPFALTGVHPFTVTSQFTVTGAMSIISFAVRPFSLGLRPFIAMFAGHILLDVFGNFVVQGINSQTAMGYGVSALSFFFVAFINALELLVGAIQAYVFALLTALYINDAVNLH